MWLKKNSIDPDGGSYKWLKRFEKLGLDGLKDKHLSARPSEVSEETFARNKKGNYPKINQDERIKKS